MPSAYSAGVKVFEKVLLQAWQKYSCGDMFASCGQRYANSRLRGGPDSNLHDDLQLELVHNGESCLALRMTPSSPWMYRTASLSKSRATSQKAPAFDVPFAVRHRASTTCGLVAAGMSGIRSILEEFALPVITSGPQHNACHVAAGGPIGTCTEV